MLNFANLVPRVSHLNAWGVKMRDPGNEVEILRLWLYWSAVKTQDYWREGGKPLRIAFVVKFPFCSSRHGQKKKSWKHEGGGKTYDPGKEETKKARKTATQRQRTSVGVTEDLRLNVAEVLQSTELAPETRRSCKEEINCWGTQNAEKG